MVITDISYDTLRTRSRKSFYQRICTLNNNNNDHSYDTLHSKNNTSLQELVTKLRSIKHDCIIQRNQNRAKSVLERQGSKTIQFELSPISTGTKKVPLRNDTAIRPSLEFLHEQKQNFLPVGKRLKGIISKQLLLENERRVSGKASGLTVVKSMITGIKTTDNLRDGSQTGTKEDEDEITITLKQQQQPTYLISTDIVQSSASVVYPGVKYINHGYYSNRSLETNANTIFLFKHTKEFTINQQTKNIPLVFIGAEVFLRKPFKSDRVHFPLKTEEIEPLIDLNLARPTFVQEIPIIFNLSVYRLLNKTITAHMFFDSPTTQAARHSCKDFRSKEGRTRFQIHDLYLLSKRESNIIQVNALSDVRFHNLLSQLNEIYSPLIVSTRQIVLPAPVPSHYTLSPNSYSTGMKRHKINDELVVEPPGKAELLNKHFANICTMTTSELNDYPILIPKSLLYAMSTFDIYESEAFELLKRIDCSKATAPGLSDRILKEAGAIVTSIITYWFNESLISEQFPKSWKLGCVTVIFKSGDYHSLSNYRPITLLPISSKN
ncbi:unnamed protein product [Didymodactylos carnosus]|uniref:Uncharacterized protein n=1 Tax=Didymodactylos carnosus TaxID=1234261 RepID=A0A814LAZ6_9BILA|nr:unnamed protein product [Didymodactylos carnosus]CAF1130641.1 unnamed protein product [Didymodactylos carnosus]CAF3830338.1 unnamed protein product [Didymodactylos carnosus]CAF3913331.1 unnamed protein product [Didymodactylos carnosus]